MITHQFWTIKPSNEFRGRWALRYHPERQMHADGSVSVSLNFPVVITSEWLSDPEQTLGEIAAILNRAPLIEVAARALLEHIDFDNNGQIIGQHAVGGHGGLISPETTHAADDLRRIFGESNG